ncbi:bifunctional DNA primase/polymerase [Pseudonocardia alni]|uniref:bifunctional DNA primase/polymerase n=1 Tax=Pseudonocardia alni TaxID=33907 RepID=UPI003F4CD28E
MYFTGEAAPQGLSHKRKEVTSMSWWDSYRAVYGAELRAAAREYADHGWPLVPGPGAEVMLATGDVLDVVEVPAAIGRQVCRTLREAGEVVPVAATPEGTWWFPMSPRHALPAELSLHTDVVLHTDGIGVVAPPTERPEGWVQWRVAPARVGYRVPEAAVVVEAVCDAVRRRGSEQSLPDEQEARAEQSGVPSALRR